ncbi:MAG: hypothetical protein ACI9B2_001262 [Flavobacteriales bacterium]|jgi:hypothetical protein
MDRKYITRLIIFKPLFLVSLSVFILNELEIGFEKPICIKSFLNDLLAPPLILSLSGVVLSLIYRIIYIFSKAQMLFFFLYLSFVFELLLPYLSSSFVADKYDVLLYAIGIILFHYLINLKLDEFKRDYKASKKCEA